jgi:hypothetical protein
MQEKELVYMVVGDKATQYEAVKKFANGKVIFLNALGKPAKWSSRVPRKSAAFPAEAALSRASRAAYARLQR